MCTIINSAIINDQMNYKELLMPKLKPFVPQTAWVTPFGIATILMYTHLSEDSISRRKRNNGTVPMKKYEATAKMYNRKKTINIIQMGAKINSEGKMKRALSFLLSLSPLMWWHGLFLYHILPGHCGDQHLNFLSLQFKLGWFWRPFQSQWKWKAI